jgi:hypothetical protein
MSRICLQHSFGYPTFSDVIFSLVKATLRVPRYENEAGVDSRYSDSEGAGRSGCSNPGGAEVFCSPHPS